MASVVSCGVCLALLGCAGEQRRFTGFLRDYSVLRSDPAVRDALVYWNPHINPKRYNAVIVEPVDVHFMNQRDEDAVRAEDLASFRKALTDALIAAIGRHATIATEPGPNVLRCRLRVANLHFTRRAREPRYSWRPPDSALGSANIETSAHDSVSGELVVAYVSPPGSIAISSPPLVGGSPDRWKLAQKAVGNHVVTIGDSYGRQVMNRDDVYVAYYHEK
ncbi:MAG: DUF3313 domain-containing protein [Phycisphaerales bacterium]|nr:DUF3313 domain-containing protein [Phycisphaerales bacterium]